MSFGSSAWLLKTVFFLCDCMLSIKHLCVRSKRQERARRVMVDVVTIYFYFLVHQFCVEESPRAHLHVVRMLRFMFQT